MVWKRGDKKVDKPVDRGNGSCVFVDLLNRRAWRSWKEFTHDDSRTLDLRPSSTASAYESTTPTLRPTSVSSFLGQHNFCECFSFFPSFTFHCYARLRKFPSTSVFLQRVSHHMHARPHRLKCNPPLEKKTPGQREFPNFLLHLFFQRRSTKRNEKSNPSVPSPPPPSLLSFLFRVSRFFSPFTFRSIPPPFSSVARPPLPLCPFHSLPPRGTCATPFYAVSFNYHSDRYT
jgi:hypothetical protein